jgi:hypothetical protein
MVLFDRIETGNECCECCRDSWFFGGLFSIKFIAVGFSQRIEEGICNGFSQIYEYLLAKANSVFIFSSVG